MKHHKTVESVVSVLYGMGYVAPVFGRHIRAIDRRVELNVSDVVVEHLQFRHVIDEVGEIERLKTLGNWIFNHSDGATGVYD